jgi:hypothetical protein
MLNGVNLSWSSFNYFRWGTVENSHYLYMLSIGVAAVEGGRGAFHDHRAVQELQRHHAQPDLAAGGTRLMNPWLLLLIPMLPGISAGFAGLVRRPPAL